MTKARIVFVHGTGRFGAAAWRQQHLMAGRYDCLFLKRTGFDAAQDPLGTDFAADARIVEDALDGGAHVVAHSQGAVAAMMAAVHRPELVRSLVLLEPACLSLSRSLPATEAHISRMEPVFAQRGRLSDADYASEFFRVLGPGSSSSPAGTLDPKSAHRLRLQAAPWEAPLQIVPGVPTLVITGGWEPLYEEVADYLVSTGADHRVVGGGHRPHDSAEGQKVLAEFVRVHAGPDR